jgi:hypothetical protein
MMPFSPADVTDEMRQPVLHAEAVSSSPDYLTPMRFQSHPPFTVLVLSDTAQQITSQPLEVTHGSVETNRALRSEIIRTNFSMGNRSSALEL